MNAIGIAGRYGPVRKLKPLLYEATCPVCLVPKVLRIEVTPHGEKARCRTCPTDHVIRHLKDHR